MDADAADDQEGRHVFADVLNDFLERFSVQQRRLDVRLLRLGDLARDVQMGLVDLGQAAVDDFFVQLFLFFEPEDLAGLFIEDARDAVEGGVMEVGIKRRDRLDRHIQRFAEVEAGHQAAERVGTAVDCHHDFSAVDRLDVLDDQHVGIPYPTNDPFRIAPDHAVFHGAHTQGAHDDEIVAVGIDVFRQDFPIPSLE